MEIELKFVVPPDRIEALAAQLLAHGARSTRLRASYFDTSDGLLDRHGLSLRLRNEGGTWVQTLKSSGDSSVARGEDNAPREGSGVQAPPLDPALHDHSHAGRALRRCLGTTPPPLIERFRTDVTRLSLVGERGGTAIDVALDRGVIRCGKRETPLAELELELKSGEPAVLFAVAREWMLPQGCWLSTVSKAQRGARLAAQTPHIPPTKATPPRLRKGLRSEALVRQVVLACLDQILGNASEVAGGSRQEEHIHQLRIGIRRLRTALRELGPLASGVETSRWEPPLVEAFRRLGELRDDDTVARAVRPLLQEAGAPSVEWPRQPAIIDTAAIVRQEAWQTAVLEMLSFAMASTDEGLSAAKTRRFVATRLSKLHRRVAGKGAEFEELPDDARHRVRKQLKRLRYLCEFIAPLFGRKRVERYLEHLRPAQDALGAHNDGVIALGKFRAAMERDPDALFAVGWLESHLSVSARACRKALSKVAAADRFWT